MRTDHIGVSNKITKTKTKIKIKLNLRENDKLMNYIKLLKLKIKT